MSGLYNKYKMKNGPYNFGGYDDFNINDAVNAGDMYRDTNDIALPPIDLGYKSNQQMLPYGGSLDTSNIATGNKWDSSFNADSVGGLFNNFSAAGFKDVAGGLGGLYGMYQGHKMLGLAKDDLNMRKTAYRDNRNRRNNFESNVSKSFA